MIARSIIKAARRVSRMPVSVETLLRASVDDARESEARHSFAMRRRGLRRAALAVAVAYLRGEGVESAYAAVEAMAPGAETTATARVCVKRIARAHRLELPAFARPAGQLTLAGVS